MSDEPEKPSSPPQGDPPLTPPLTPPPSAAILITKVDGAIGLIEHAFVAFAVFGLIGVGTARFLSSHLLDSTGDFPYDKALRYLVFFCAMGGASLSAQKGRMISMDFLARKLAPKAQVFLRILVASFVIFACFLLYKGGMDVRDATSGEDYELFNPAIALLALPVGAALIGLHYLLHAIVDATYLAAGRIPPVAEGPSAH